MDEGMPLPVFSDVQDQSKLLPVLMPVDNEGVSPDVTEKLIKDNVRLLLRIVVNQFISVVVAGTATTTGRSAPGGIKLDGDLRFVPFWHSPGP